MEPRALRACSTRTGRARAHRAKWAALLAAAVLIVAGCGSSAPAKKDFASSYATTIGSYRSEFTSLQDKARLAIGSDLDTELGVFAHMGDVTHTTLRALRALTPPTSIRPTYQRLLVTMTQQESSLQQIQSSARTNDQTALSAALTTYASDLQNVAALQQQVQDATAPTTTHS
jgi:hypothetical protein